MNIFKWFIKKPQIQNTPINTLLLSLDEANRPFIHIRIEHLTEESAQSYADLLFSLTTGLYNQSLINTLSDIASKDTNIYMFVEKIMEAWRLLNNEEQKAKEVWDNEPQVKPTSFNKTAK